MHKIKTLEPTLHWDERDKSMLNSSSSTFPLQQQTVEWEKNE